MEELKELNLSETTIERLPQSIKMMTKLEVLDAADCYQLEEIPCEIFDGLAILRRLDLSLSPIKTLPSTISQLPSLQLLQLYNTNELRELPELPSSLMELYVSSDKLEKVPDLSRLINLAKLELLGCDVYHWPKTSMFNGIEKLVKLEELKLGSSSLSDVGIGHDGPRLALPDLSNLKSLSIVEFTNIHGNYAFESIGIRKLKMVKQVTIENCDVDAIEQWLTEGLARLDINYCKSLPNLSHLQHLHELYIHSCKDLVEISGLGELKSLSELDISHCDSLKTLLGLSKLEKLSKLSLSNCPELTSVESSEQLCLSSWLIEDCPSLKNVPFLD